MADVDMQAFWDARARENAAFFVDNRLDYADTDMDAFWAAGEEGVDFLTERLGFAIGASEELVEVGCGIGRITRVLAARARSVRALDVSAEMLAQARAHHTLPNVTWLHGDGRTLTGVEDASADGVFSHVVFQHVPSADITYGYVADMGRVLRPGGWAAFQVSDDPSIHVGRESVGRRVKAALGRAPKGASHPAWLGSAVDMTVLRRVAGEAGLRVERTHGEGTQLCLVLLRK